MKTHWAVFLFFHLEPGFIKVHFQTRLDGRPKRTRLLRFHQKILPCGQGLKGWWLLNFTSYQGLETFVLLPGILDSVFPLQSVNIYKYSWTLLKVLMCYSLFGSVCGGGGGKGARIKSSSIWFSLISELSFTTSHSFSPVRSGKRGSPEEKDFPVARKVKYFTIC